MKPGDQGEREFLDKIHRNEEDIDLFLKKKQQEADGIILKARQQAEGQRVQAAREALAAKEMLSESLIRTAEDDAEKILAKGLQVLETEKAVLEQVRSTVTKKIMDHLLGRET